MSHVRRGILLGALQAALVLSVAAKYARDRATLPRAWAVTAPVDPEMPIRGRYVRLRLVVAYDSALQSYPAASATWIPVRLAAEQNRLVAYPSVPGSANAVSRVGHPPRWSLVEPVAFYLPEHTADPAIRPLGEELWVEVSVPPAGPPRPVRLGVRRAGMLTPLDLH